nr:MAG TPA: hypothetical protein [Caudoviricetes sp.]
MSLQANGVSLPVAGERVFLNQQYRRAKHE